MKLKFLSLGTGLVFTSLALSACGTATNTNINANMRNMNSNTAIVVNSNTNLSNANMSNSNRWNANVNRADYDKNRADYEKDKGSSTIGQGANDSWLWFKTKAALATTDDLRDSTINVDVVNDVVTLKGTVANAAQKASAVKTAKEIEGVKSVTDQLKVAAEDSMTNMSSSNSNANGNRR
ncbi:MAG: BON domain-containing protein [Saprospiraceae bacterium]|nr:BON domain-containing protein [Pyrinomonadaceae bacterium]